MNTMIKQISIFAFILSFFTLAQAQVKMEYYLGAPVVRRANEKPKPITVKNAGQLFAKDFSLTTKASEFVKIIINEDYELNIFDSSQMEFVLIRDEMSGKKESEQDLHVYKMRLAYGQIMIKRLDLNREHIVPKDIRFESDFFQWDLVDKKRSSLELMVSLNPSLPNVRFCNARSDYTIKLFDHEKEVALKSFEGIAFTGVLEKQRVAYDLLLQGKRIPKGSWEKTKSCSFSELTEKETAFRDLQNQRKQSALEKINRLKKKKADNDAQYLCHQPYGQFNDCHWKNENEVCTRYRCNADGQWGARTELTARQNHFCIGRNSVAKCNY
jgi:hypothetical protein